MDAFPFSQLASSKSGSPFCYCYPPTAPTAPILSLHMTAILTSNSSASSSNFGLLNFLDTQVAFDSIVPDTTSLYASASQTAGASIDSLSLPAALNKFLDPYKFHPFLPIFWSDYVGTFAPTMMQLLFKQPSLRSRNFPCLFAIHLLPPR